MIDEAAESDKREAHCAGPESVTIPSGSAERSEDLARISHEAAYPEVEFLPSSRNWWAWLKGTPAECIHLNGETSWMVTLLPDTLYLQGKRAARREPVRPEVSLCRACLADVARGELEAYRGRVVAFEPSAEDFTQYFFVAAPDFDPVGLAPEVSNAITGRLSQKGGDCADCGHAATWLWLSREEVTSLDDVDRIDGAAGERLCAKHGARKLFGTFGRIREANVFYMNLPYGEAGAYVWI
jgi:hypothetical protein